jgi:hypothetical protein
VQTKLVNYLRRNASKSDKVKVRQRMEDKIVPWVIANLTAFPELPANDFVFVHLMPVTLTPISVSCIL